MTGRTGRVLACFSLALFGLVARPSCGQPPPCTSPPTVTCPANITRSPDPGGSSATVHYVASASDICGLKSLDCTPSSGSVFPSGTTTVTCTAVNLGDFSASCSFEVTVISRPLVPTLGVRGLLAFALLLMGFGALLARRM